MPDPTPTKEQLEAKAKADAEAKAKFDADMKAKHDAAAKAAAPEADKDTALAETLKAMQQRLMPTVAAHATVGLDEGPPGGVAIVKGKKVNSNGRELNDDGSIMHPEQLRVNEFGQLV